MEKEEHKQVSAKSFRIGEHKTLVVFVRVGFSFGYYFEFAGKRYEDWLQITKEDCEREGALVESETFKVLRAQAVLKLSELI